MEKYILVWGTILLALKIIDLWAFKPNRLLYIIFELSMIVIIVCILCALLAIEPKPIAFDPNPVADVIIIQPN